MSSEIIKLWKGLYILGLGQLGQNITVYWGIFGPFTCDCDVNQDIFRAQFLPQCIFPLIFSGFEFQ